MAARQALALLAILAVVGTAAAGEDKGKGKQCSKRGKEPCPTCLPAKAGCIKTKCSAEHPGYAKITLKSKKCFTTEKISYAAMSYGDERKAHVCKDNKKSKGDDKFEILAKCGSNITIFLQDGKYYNKRGHYFPPASNPCSKKCDSKKSCDTCGPYTVPVICSCAPPPRAVFAPPPAKPTAAPRVGVPPPRSPAVPPKSATTPPAKPTAAPRVGVPPPRSPAVPPKSAVPPPATPTAAPTRPPRTCRPKKWNCNRHGKCRNHQSPCPFCYKTLRECFSCIGCSKKPGYGKVVLKAKRCFKKSITFAAVSYKDESGSPVCVDNKRFRYYDREAHKESKFAFSAPCGSTVTLYLVDDSFFNTNGPLVLKKKTNPCVNKCDPRKPCSTCGPYTFTVRCPPRCLRRSPPPLSRPPPGTPSGGTTPPPVTPTAAPRIGTPPPRSAAVPPKSATPPPATPTASPRVGTPPPRSAAVPPKSATTPPVTPTAGPRVGTPPPRSAAVPPKSATTPPVTPTAAPRVGTPPPRLASTPPKTVATPPPPPTCPVTPHSRSCPTCIPSTKGCIKYSCSKWDGYAKVTLKGSKCFDKPISFMAIAHNDEDAHPKCAHNKQKKSNNEFTFYAKCGQEVAVYLSDPKFSNQKGPLAITGGNPCSTPCKEQGSACQTCGRYKIYIDCKCTKKAHHHSDKKKHG